MKKLLWFIIGVLLIQTAYSVNFYTDSPAKCPTEYNTISCLPQLVCGISGSNPYCYTTTSLNPPASPTASDAGDTYQASLNGGWIIDCYGTDASSPYCDNSGAFWCNRNDTCYTTKIRKTVCSGGLWINSSCGDCRTGYQDCTGDNVCECTTGSSACNICGFASGTHNVAAASCACNCVSGYQSCTGLGSSGVAGTNGCACQTGQACNSGGCPIGDVSTHNQIAASCGCSCTSGYQDCDSSGAQTGTGCEVTTDSTDYPTGAHNNYAAGCTCACDANYKDCNAGGCSATDGCEYHYNVACATHATNSSTCATGCACDSGYFDCNSDLALGTGGNGCEVQTSTACTVGGVAGIYNGCTCVVTKQIWYTGNLTSYSTATNETMLWGRDYGTGYLINITNNAYNISFLVNQSGHIWGSIHCSNITGATSNLCTLTAGASGVSYAGDGIWLYNDSAKMYFNTSTLNTTINVTINLYLNNASIIRTWNTSWITVSVGNWSYDKWSVINVSNTSWISLAVGNWSYDRWSVINTSNSTWVVNIIDNATIIRSYNISWISGAIGNSTIIRAENTSWITLNVGNWSNDRWGVINKSNTTWISTAVGNWSYDRWSVINTSNTSWISIAVGNWSFDKWSVINTSNATWVVNIMDNATIIRSYNTTWIQLAIGNATIIRTENGSWVWNIMNNNSIMRYTMINRTVFNNDTGYLDLNISFLDTLYARISNIATLIDNSTIIRSYNLSWIQGAIGNATIIRAENTSWIQLAVGNYSADKWGIVNYTFLDNSTIIRTINFSWVTSLLDNTTIIHSYNISWISGAIGNATIIRAENTSWITNNQLKYNGTAQCTGTDKVTNVTVNTSGVYILCGADATGTGGGVNYRGDQTWLYNDTTTMYFNTSTLNSTIGVLMDNNSIIRNINYSWVTSLLDNTTIIHNYNYSWVTSLLDNTTIMRSYNTTYSQPEYIFTNNVTVMQNLTSGVLILRNLTRDITCTGCIYNNGTGIIIKG